MALQFSLASVNPAGVTKPIDFAGIEQKQLGVEQSRLDVAEQQRQVADAAQTRGAFDEYLKQGGDLFTPTGLKKATVDLRGKIPVSEYMKLGPALQKAQEADVKYRSSLQKLSDDELSGQLGIFSTAGPQVDALYKTYEKTKAEKGDVSAKGEFDSSLQSLLAQAAPLWGKSPYGQQALKTLSGLTPEQVPMLNRMSGYSAAALKEEAERRQAELRAAQAKRAEAESEALKGGKDWKQFVDADGNTYRSSALLGRTQKLDKASGEWTDYAAGVPTTAKPLGAKGAGVNEQDVTLTQDENRFLAEWTQITGKPVPGIPAGAANKQARVAYLKEFVNLAKDRGYDASEAGAIALQRDASREALKRQTTQNATIVAGEKDLENVMTTLKEELKKVGGPDSPVLRKYMNRASTEWLGDPAFTGINAAWANFQETAAKVFSGQTGAGGTPVSYLKLAQESLGTNPNLAQVMKLDETMRKLFKAREKAADDTRKMLLDQAQMPTKAGSPAAERAKTMPDDNEAAKILRKEYDAAVAKVNDTQLTPEQRARAREDARATRAELKRLKVDVPEPGEPTAAAGKDDLQAQVTKAFGKYEPTIYDYRVSPEGKVQRRKKQ